MSGHPAKAAELLSEAAAQGNAAAQATLGRMYRNGEGVPQDIGRGLALFQQAAAQGFEPAQTVLAQIAREAGNATPSAAAAEVAEAPP
jgi:TPR repeat protein